MFDRFGMALFAGIAGLLSVIVGWLVTARLFALARKTRAVPEQLLAVAFGGLFCVGYPMAGASRAPGLEMTNEGALLFAIGAIGMIVGASALGRFPYVVFRPGNRWAALLSFVLAALGVVGGIGCAVSVMAATTREAMIANIQSWALALMISILAIYAWNAFESFRYYRIMKRREKLGLANAETTHRFLLWAIASACSVLSIGSIAAIRATGVPILSSLPMSILSSTTLVTTTCWWLAFFMPDAYRRRVLGVDPEDAADENADAA